MSIQEVISDALLTDWSSVRTVSPTSDACRSAAQTDLPALATAKQLFAESSLPRFVNT